MPICLSVPLCVAAFEAYKLLFSREEANKREEEELQFRREELSCHIDPRWFHLRSALLNWKTRRGRTNGQLNPLKPDPLRSLCSTGVPAR